MLAVCFWNAFVVSSANGARGWHGRRRSFTTDSQPWQTRQLQSPTTTITNDAGLTPSAPLHSVPSEVPIFFVDMELMPTPVPRAGIAPPHSEAPYSTLSPSPEPTVEHPFPTLAPTPPPTDTEEVDFAPVMEQPYYTLRPTTSQASEPINTQNAASAPTDSSTPAPTPKAGIAPPGTEAPYRTFSPTPPHLSELVPTPKQGVAPPTPTEAPYATLPPTTNEEDAPPSVSDTEQTAAPPTSIPSTAFPFQGSSPTPSSSSSSSPSATDLESTSPTKSLPLITSAPTVPKGIAPLPGTEAPYRTLAPTQLKTDPPTPNPTRVHSGLASAPQTEPPFLTLSPTIPQTGTTTGLDGQSVLTDLQQVPNGRDGGGSGPSTINIVLIAALSIVIIVVPTFWIVRRTTSRNSAFYNHLHNKNRRKPDGVQARGPPPEIFLHLNAAVASASSSIQGSSVGIRSPQQLYHGIRSRHHENVMVFADDVSSVTTADHPAHQQRQPLQQQQQQELPAWMMSDQMKRLGSTRIAALNVPEHTKRAMLAEAIENRIYILSEELEQLVDDPVMAAPGGVSMNRRSETSRTHAVMACSKEIKTLQKHYEELTSPDPSSSPLINIDNSSSSVSRSIDGGANRGGGGSFSTSTNPYTDGGSSRAFSVGASSNPYSQGMEVSFRHIS